MILFVDDDIRSLRPFREEFTNRGLKFRMVNSVDEAMRVLKNHATELQFIVLDMAMPTGNLFRGRVLEGGLQTGEHFYREIRKALPDTHILLFTNHPISRIDSAFRDDPNCEIRMKQELLPSDLADRVDQLLARRARG